MSFTPMPSAPMPSAPRPPRSPWQLVYGAAHRWRRRRWEGKATRLPRPVISVGNLHWGGVGKTPLVIAVATHLRDAGRRVAVLSRGYKRRSRGVRVVSHGGSQAGGSRPDPREVGDEPALMARELPGVAVVVGERRDEAGRVALDRLEPAPEVFLLDDGFSHLRLARDLDLLVFPASDPYGGGRLPPGGRLREPLASSARAHAALLTGEPERATPEAARELAQGLRGFGFRGPGFAAPTHTGPARRLDGGPLDPDQRVLLVSAIARPERFTGAAMRAARETGFTITAELRLGDHDPYRQATLDRIRKEADRRDATVVLTTAKDLVKLENRLDLPLALLPHAAQPEPAFFAWMDTWLDEWWAERVERGRGEGPGGVSEVSR